MSARRAARGLAPVHLLLLVALLELVVNRVAIGSKTSPGLATLRLHAGSAPPDWYRYLSYAGLFLFYFAGTLAVVVLAGRIASLMKRGLRDRIAGGALAIAGVLAAMPLLVAGTASTTFALEIAFAIAVLLVVAASFGKNRDVGVQLGTIMLAVPLLVHTLSVVGGKLWWPDGAFDAPGLTVQRTGILTLCLAALTSPYLFAPRPFARSVTKPAPVLLAMTVAAIGAIAARTWYPTIAKGAALAIGVELSQGVADPRLALYLLAIATLTWTLASCAFAESPSRRQIGAGLALVILGGYAFRWPHHYLLPLLGLAMIVDVAHHVRDEELEAMPISSDTPPINDNAWATYIAAVKRGLERSLAGVHTLTTRGDQGLMSSLITGERVGVSVRVRVERIEGSVMALDVVIGRELDEMRAATLTLWAIPPRALGINPAGPPAAPLFKTGDAQFDERFKTRGNSQALQSLFDEGLRARAVATLDGWFAYWDGQGLRYRVYPGRGAPLDHPIPLSDLSLGRPATADRLVAVIELLVDVAVRAVIPASEFASEPDQEPTELS